MSSNRRPPIWVLVTAAAVLAAAGAAVYVLSRDVGGVVPLAVPMYQPPAPDVIVSESSLLSPASDANAINCLAFSPDAKLIAAGRLDGKADVWDVPGQKRIRQLEAGKLPICAVAFSPDGKLVAGSPFGTVVYVWEAQSGDLVARIEDATAGFFAISFLPSGLLAVGRGDGSLTLWDVQEERRVASVDGDGHPPTAMALSKDGTRLAGRSEDGYVQVWDVARRQLIATYEVEQPDGRRLPDLDSHSIAFSPDDPEIVLVPDEKGVLAVGPHGKRPMTDLTTGIGQVRGIATDALGRTLFVRGFASFELRGAHGEQLTEEPTTGLGGTAADGAISSDGSTVAMADSNRIQLFHVEDRRTKGNAGTRPGRIKPAAE